MRWAVVLVVLCFVPLLAEGDLSGLTSLDWSRDGKNVLFVDGGEVWVGLAPEGRQARRLTEGAGADWARFGPGDWFVYATPVEGGYALWRGTLEGKREELLRQGAPILRPTVSPDGTRVAFISERDGQWDLFCLDLGARAMRRLTHTSGPEDTPDFSPDGRFLVFVALWSREPTGSWDVYILDLEGGWIEQLTDDQHFDWAPRFSPDGEWIAFESTSRGPSDIHLMRRDGTQRVPFTMDRWRDAFPCWSPSGDRIAYGSFRPPGKWMILAATTS